ncbi:MAG: septum site-determining protein MinC [Lachnospiraceae bacterium]|nr:septum site-determining protein MinC [Lachnospiraceae bacterium]
MSTPVVLKSNRYGINLILDSEIGFEELLGCISQRFQESAAFFKDARLAVSFEGRELTQEEEFRIVEAITGNSSIEIICILDNDMLREEMVRQKIEQFEEEQSGRTGEFYKGTLRSGQVLDCESSIVILGDINPGAKIISKGNIVVLGALKGNAYAGASGNEQAFVAALDMDPIQIRIGDVIARSADKPSQDRTLLGKKKGKKKPEAAEPQVAVVKDGNIYIEPITKGLLNSI